MIIVVARAARTGLQSYGPDDEEQRDAAEVFSPESMASWVGVPVTIGHLGWLEVDSVDEVAVGYVASVERDRGDGDGVEFVRARVVLTDEEAIAKFKSGELAEFSAGYSVDLSDDDPPRQSSIRINHLAAGPRGWARCGEACTTLAA